MFGSLKLAWLACTQLILFALMLAGCSSGQDASLLGQSPIGEGGAKTVSLSAAQVKLYQNGLMEIVPNRQTADYKSVTALEFTGKPGVHICGYVTFEDEGGKRSEKRFYVELRRQEGSDDYALHRGQLGTDAAKLSKVKFVCRHHEKG